MSLNEGPWTPPIAFYPHHISNNKDQARQRLLAQYQDRPKFVALIESTFGSPAQRAADLIWSLLEIWDIDNAEGVILENIGRLVGQSRLGKTDAQYRLLIRARIARNTSRGLWAHIVNAWKYLTGATSVALTEIFPAGMQINSDGVVVPGEEAFVIEFITAVIPAGVEFIGYFPFPDADTFGFSPTSAGFSSDGSTGGGPFYA